MPPASKPFASAPNSPEPFTAHLALKAAHLGIWELDLLTQTVNGDDRCRALFGLSEASPLPYAQFRHQIHPDDVARLEEDVRQAMQPRAAGGFDITCRTAGGGSPHRVRLLGQCFRNASGDAYRLTGVAQEVPGDQPPQPPVNDTHEPIAAFVEQMPVAIGLFGGTDHVFEVANAQFSYLLGQTTDQLLGKPLRAFWPTFGQQSVDDVLNTVCRTGAPFVFPELSVTHRRGMHTEVDYYQLVCSKRLDQADPTGVMIVATEVTESVLARQKVLESEATFRSLIEEAPVATCLFVGHDMTIDVANDIMLGYWGKEKSVIGQSLIEAVPELRGQPFLQILDEVFATGRTHEAKAARAELMVDGVLGTYYFDFTYKPLRNAAGTVYGIMDMAVDVTEQVISRVQLEESELFSRSIINHSPIAKLVLVGDTMRIRTINENMLSLLGRDVSITGKPFMEAMPELVSTNIMTRLRHVLATGETYYQPEEKSHLIRFGKPYIGYYNYIYTALSNTAGERYGIMMTATEVTEQVLARQKIEESEVQFRTLSAELDQQVQLRTQQLQASVQDLQRSNQNLQQFAYIASHDLQEPLRKIQSFGDLLKNNHAPELGTGVEYLHRMQAAARRMSTLIKDLLTFSRISTQQDDSKWVPLTQIAQAAVSDLELVIDETRAIIDLDSLPTVQGDPTQLSQLFQNLLSNALKFRRPDITPIVRVHSQLVPIGALPPSVRPTRLAEAYHQISISDNGIGFDDKYVDRIFQVFQRLHGKSEYIGTGIGLAICEKVAANHGGAITATSQPGQGSTFFIYLPTR